MGPTTLGTKSCAFVELVIKRIEWAAAFYVAWRISLGPCLLICVYVYSDSAWLEVRQNTTHSERNSVGGKYVMLTVDKAKLQEMVLNNMGAAYPPLCLYSGSLHHKGHLCGQLQAAQFTRTGSSSTQFILIFRKRRIFIYFSFHGFKGEIQPREYTCTLMIVFYSSVLICRLELDTSWTEKEREADCSDNKILELLHRQWIMKPLLQHCEKSPD